MCTWTGLILPKVLRDDAVLAIISHCSSGFRMFLSEKYMNTPDFSRR